ncbi:MULTISPECIES: adenosylmethionine decarboxylase [Pyrobaculum]|uniref:Arginine decarboxylase proenzyme n=2 Tax=Pyrobaculum arsenaticum TaxID=121277 RepID=ARGDC_PYRAR|nr:adenosylmethionine decarboxylase [Pyrobaculum arsenaticum]A4WIW6.1 RecName: Full=Arginine decarboxylase proenzyme; Short=ADC; Short=ArgDC; AltName: Full=Pyruvoyl-dependent arginine decarboxylase; Contains: RecName: Full=Arginine decarboxylase beta chain; Contains: RecName: Full=Arginine decarboxylase alpha chain; Flags: Precursor [Pyrobaculum arsenaticum DSM 13514]ABP50333.1 arginine decarboxylase [Pyrobaculum arsenaticum DSM 13514]MCY0890319.1 adenosylmethionine decarboxylase [Pyrobaculum ar
MARGGMEARAQTQVKTPVVGKHVYGELYGVDEKLLQDEGRLRQIVIEAAHIANMHLVEVNSWRFKGGDKEGVSVIALVLESHIAIHTWPTYKFATVDVYTCGEHSDPMSAFRYIVSQLSPKRFTVNYSDRSYK